MTLADHASVVEFYADGTHKYVLRNVTAKKAALKAMLIIESDDAKSGKIVRVMINDILDRNIFDWEHGKGIVHPAELVTSAPCASCPWTIKGQPDIKAEHRAAAEGGAWFCCHVHLGTCYGAQRYAEAVRKREKSD